MYHRDYNNQAAAHSARFIRSFFFLFLFFLRISTLLSHYIRIRLPFFLVAYAPQRVAGPDDDDDDDDDGRGDDDDDDRCDDYDEREGHTARNCSPRKKKTSEMKRKNHRRDGDDAAT